LNDDINRASQQLASVIYAERAQRERQEVSLSDALEDFGIESEPEAVATGSKMPPWNIES